MTDAPVKKLKLGTYKYYKADIQTYFHFSYMRVISEIPYMRMQMSYCGIFYGYFMQTFLRALKIK
jgi:hypothetical protein